MTALACRFLEAFFRRLVPSVLTIVEVLVKNVELRAKERLRGNVSATL